MSDNSNTLCTNLQGGIAIGEYFRPVNSEAVITDIYGYEWKQETAAGWRRKVDDFFIPMGPNGNFYNHRVHSVEKIKSSREKM
jgi:hypothetical protein